MSGEKTLPQYLTSYDLVKSFALIIMMIDHIGGYFFPDQIWWRSIGRIGFPVWFFLIGHASGRDIPVKLWGGALLLVGMNIIVGIPVFALNALVTIIGIRLLMDFVMDYALRSEGHLWRVFVLCVLLVVPASMLSEYGTMALLFAMMGYMVRHRDKLQIDKYTQEMFFCFSLGVFLFFEALIFNMSGWPLAFMVVGTALTTYVLYHFKPQTYQQFKGIKVWPLQFMGRRTLEIYVVHLVLFKLAMFLTGEAAFMTLDWGFPEL